MFFFLMLPMLIWLFCYFILGIYFGFRSIFSQEKKFVEFCIFVGVFLFFHAGLFLIPHLIFFGKHINQFGMPIILLATASAFPVIVFVFSMFIGLAPKFPANALFISAILLASGCIPIAYFLFGSSILKIMRITLGV